MNKEQKRENKASGTTNEERRTKNKSHKASRFLVLNQFVPPDPAPTARLLGEVAAELQARGHEVVLVGGRASYHGHKTLFGSRALRELASLVRLFFRALFTRRVDAIVCLTSPPLLPVVAWLARFRHRGAKLIHWAMDLYPDVAVALGEVREGSLLHRITAAMMGRVYRSCDLIVALDEDMAGRIALHGAECEVQPPWPPPIDFAALRPSPLLSVAPIAFRLPPPALCQRPAVWLYSGNLGRAHEWKTLLDAQHQLEKEEIEIDLVFQGGGAEREAAREYAATLGLTRCHWQGYADDADLIHSLLEADVLIATQRPETKGCLWPSKLALALLLDRPIVWIGPGDGAVTALLKGSGHFCFVPGESSPLADCLRSLSGDQEFSREKTAPQELIVRIEEARRAGISARVEKFQATLSVPISGCG